MVKHLYVAPAKGASPRAVDVVDAIAGRGLEGDRYAEPRNRKDPSHEVTLIEAESIAAFTRETGLAMAPHGPRRNVVTEGVRLNGLVGRRFRVGEALLEGLELCEPCGKFARATHREALKFFVGRGGLRARIVEGGVIRVGDPIGELPPAARQARSEA